MNQFDLMGDNNIIIELLCYFIIFILVSPIIVIIFVAYKLLRSNPFKDILNFNKDDLPSV
jgi:hypothetical protein